MAELCVCVGVLYVVCVLCVCVVCGCAVCAVVCVCVGGGCACVYLLQCTHTHITALRAKFYISRIAPCLR